MADNASEQIKTLSVDVRNLDERLEKAIQHVETYDKDIAYLFKQAREKGMANLDQLVDYLSKRFSKLQIKTAIAPLMTFDEKEIDKAARKYASLLEKQDFLEKSRSIAVGGRKFVELRGEDLKNWREFSTLLSSINEQKKQIEQSTPGAAEAGQKIYKEQLAFQKAQEVQDQESKRIAQEKAEAKRKAAEDERQLNKEIAEEEKRRTEEAKQRYKEAIDANKSMVKEEEELAKLRREQRVAESKSAYNEYFKKQQNAQKQADKESLNNQRRQIQLKAEMAAIDKKRAMEGKQLTTEEKTRYREISAELTKLIAKQKELDAISQGSGKRARGKLSKFEISEAEKAMRRYGNAVQETKNKQQGLNNETSKLLPTLQRLASAFGVAFSVRGLAQFGKKLIETRGEFELQQVALRSILQNKQLADEIWDKTMRAALQSPFTAMQLTKYTKQLAAYRIETDKLFDTTKRLADVSAGLGVDMQRLILAYGQVKAANYLRASEIRQFTEAGVNILGELSQYFTEAKGEMVSTAQVMDMVQKRMVRFEDVAEIFKRMTDQGGIFYNMQYIQSQTVKGQMMKLRDAYDQMLNSIGQGNEGVIKNLISLLNDIVKNWREWKTVIDLIAWPVIISMLHKFALGLIAVDAAAIKASTGMNTMVVAGARLQLLFKRLWAAIAKHPLFALASALAAVGVALWNHAQAVAGINKAYEDLMLRTYETQKALSGYSDTLQRNAEVMKTAQKGTDAYNEASKENEKIISKLSNDYPDLLKDIDLQKDGYGALIAKIETYNKKLEDRIRLEYAARASFGTDDLATNIADLQEAQRKREMEFLENREKAERLYLDLKARGRGVKEKNWNKRMRLAKNWAEQVDILEQNEAAMRGGGISLLSQGFVMPGIGGFWGGGVQSRMADLSANIKKESLVYNDIIREQLKAINEDLGDDIEQFIKDNQSEVDKLFKDKKGEGWKLLNERITEFFTAKGVAGQESQQAIQDLINQYLLIPIQLDWDAGATSVTNYKPDPETNREAFSKMIPLIKEMRAEYDKLSKSAYGYAKSEDEVRKSYKKAVEEILGKAGVTSDYDFTTNEGMIAALLKVQEFAKTLKDGTELAKQVEKVIGSLRAEIGINVEVRNRENFAREIEKMFSDYELTIDLQKINLPANAAQDLLGLDYTSLSDVMNKITTWREQQIASKAFSEDDMKLYETWMKKVTDKLYAMQKEKAKQYTKYLEHELSERAKLEMQYTTDVAFVKANYQDGSQKDMILTNLEKNYSDAINELKWKSFKESSFYVEMMQDLTTMPSEYLNMMMTKLNEWAEKADALSPKALKEVLKAREKIIEAQVAMSPIRALGTSLGGIREVQQGYFLNEDNEEEMFSSNIKEARRQLEGVILAREQNMDLIRQQLDAEESLLGKLTAQENIQRTINELVGSGYEGVGVESTLDEIQQAIEDNRSLLNQIEPTQAARETDEDFQKRLRQYTEEQAELQGIINLLIELKTQRQQADAMGLDMSKPVSASKEGTLANVRKYKQELDRLEKTQSKDQSRLVYFKQYNTAVHGLAQNIADVTGKVKGINGAIYNMMDALGETDEITELWKQFGDAMVDSITNVLNLIPALITGYTAAGVAINSAMGIIGLIAEAIQLTITLITFLIQLSDKQKDKEIEKLQKQIDELKNAYERLEKQIEKTWDTMSYIEDYNKMIKNLNDQIKALEAQRQAESDKKKTDESKISDYNKAIQDAKDELEELKQKQIEVFGGLGEVNYRSTAQEFVDAWKEAFLETGDGLQGLQDHFDEFLQEWFVKQATMRVAGRMLEPLFKQIDTAVDESSQGGANVLLSELQRVREKFATIAPQLSDALEQLAGMWGLGKGEGGLSGLAAGIQGMTEEQANILEADWNSVRMYTASIDMNVSRIADMLGAGSRDITNPQLQQLQLIAANAQATHQLLLSTSKSGHPMGGYGFKVFND